MKSVQIIKGVLRRMWRWLYQIF